MFQYFGCDNSFLFIASVFFIGSDSLGTPALISSDSAQSTMSTLLTQSSAPLFVFKAMTRHVQPTIEHFQLRHCIATSTASDVYFAAAGMF